MLDNGITQCKELPWQDSICAVKMNAYIEAVARKLPITPCETMDHLYLDSYQTAQDSSFT